MNARKVSSASQLAWQLSLLLSLMVLAGALLGSEGWAVSSLQADIALMTDIRLPRTLGACLAGALLGLAGAVAQGLFRNPLADPYLLGSASGASLGVALGMVMLSQLDVSPWLVRAGVTGMAFMGAWLAVALSLMLSWGVQHTLRLLLAGVVVGVVLGAIASLLLVMYPQIQGSVQSFMLGSTAYVSWSACGLMLSVLIVSGLVSYAASPLLDGLALGESTALSLGLPVKSLRWVLLAVLALCTAAAVAQTGLIAFVGLAAPHLVRARYKGIHGKTLSLSCLMGAVLLGGADLLARGLMAPLELPVGVLTAILGGGYMLYLMRGMSPKSSGGRGGRA
ncbi:MAG: iron ABC transporter permease [Betaproteobacteria bacterium]|jgi:iron complex transport system permease protein|nr:iron ABC transporter permease [Betaproteobacteria bacterium]NDD23147.1 iron ABC transporter permease [Betaproteobacteria bacterium]